MDDTTAPPADPGALDELRHCAVMIRTWLPESYPTDAAGRVHFVRAVMESVAAVIDRVAPPMTTPLLPTILDAIAAERGRQVRVEGWTAESDDQQGNGQLGRAAAYYAAHHAAFTYRGGTDFNLALAADRLWPWDAEGRKPKDARANLIRAGALIVAEIERLDRVAPPESNAAAHG